MSNWIADFTSLYFLNTFYIALASYATKRHFKKSFLAKKKKNWNQKPQTHAFIFNAQSWKDSSMLWLLSLLVGYPKNATNWILNHIGL